MPFTLSHPLPVIIQGGMGVGISSWQLALARYHRPEGRGERPYLPPSPG